MSKAAISQKYRDRINKMFDKGMSVDKIMEKMDGVSRGTLSALKAHHTRKQSAK